MSDVFVANDPIADVQVRSATQLYVFGKAAAKPPSTPPPRAAAWSMPPTSASAATSARSTR